MPESLISVRPRRVTDAASNAPAPTMAPKTFPEAAVQLRQDFHWNSWFLNTYWPENEPRMHRMAEVVDRRFPAAAGGSVLEVGCANGYAAALFRMLGYQVTATDAYDDPDRDKLFLQHGIPYTPTNLNDLTPLKEFADASFDIVLLGEVFEHILNCPAALLKGLYRILKPGGLLILTTPNPSTLANSLRVLTDGYVLWGTDEFMHQVKFDGEKIIDFGGIHYREYPLRITRQVLEKTGFGIGTCAYVSPGASPSQSGLKRLLKGFLRITHLDRWRLLSPGYLIEAYRPKSNPR
jgi:SAM-dependent methyltransferase